MRVAFQEKPLDLYLSIGYTIVTTTALVLLGAGAYYAILLVLFVPGYVVVGALFPGKAQLAWPERLALSCGLSLIVGPLLALAVSVTPFGIRFTPFTATIAIFTVLVGAAAYRRRMQLSPGDRLSASLELLTPQWRDNNPLEKALTLVLATSIVVSAGAIGYFLAKPHPDEPFTEFYILGPAGYASGYPTRLNISQLGTVILGIMNHESSSMNYTVRIDLVGVRVVYNTTARVNETVEVNRTTWSWFNVSLASGQNWTKPYTFRISETGIWKVQFRLFKDDDFSTSYREVHLYVRVSGS